jgi:predicted nucleic acid-binding protein
VTFLLDTNVVSEWVKPRPNPGLMSWLVAVDEDRVFLSVVTLAEIRFGIDRMPDGRRRRRLDDWLRIELPSRFESRVLPINEPIANEWGKVVARRAAAGRQIGAMDAFVAATANIHELTLVTRNIDDFRLSLNALINPWTT